jgi:hypothetical protein
MSDTIIELCKLIDSGDFDLLPILADALEDIGWVGSDILRRAINRGWTPISPMLSCIELSKVVAEAE